MGPGGYAARCVFQKNSDQQTQSQNGLPDLQVRLLTLHATVGMLIDNRLRRVKCDERKPSCERCESAGRKCEGYPQTVVTKKTETDPAMALLLRRSPDTHHGTEAEIAALEFFYRKTAPQLSSYFDAEFWTRLVFQVQASEGAIRHAMIALGSLSR